MHGREWNRGVLLEIILLLLLIQGVAAWNVTSVSVQPSGVLTPGMQVLVSLKIDSVDQPALHQPYEIRLSTDLENQKWTQTYLADGYENCRCTYVGKEHLLDELPIRKLEGVRITLEGEAPFLSQPKNITIIRVEELDVNGNVVASAPVYEYGAVVVNEPVAEQTISLQKNLESFRSQINETASRDVHTAVEARFAEATNSSNGASLQTPAPYIEKSRLPSSAEISINGGKRLLETPFIIPIVGIAAIIILIAGIFLWRKRRRERFL